MSERDRRIVLETPRLRIRQFTPDDASRLFDLNSDPEVMRFLGPVPSLETLRDETIPFHLAVYQRFDRLGTWAAEDRATWNQGYATEGSAALIEMGFAELGVERVFAHTMTVNVGSRRVGPGPVEGAEDGQVEYALTRAGWEAFAARKGAAGGVT